MTLLDLKPIAAHQLVRETRQANNAAIRDAKFASGAAVFLLVMTGIVAAMYGPSIGSPVVIIGALMLHAFFRRRREDAERAFWHAQMRAGLVAAIDEQKARGDDAVVDLRDHAEVIDLRERSKTKRP